MGSLALHTHFYLGFASKFNGLSGLEFPFQPKLGQPPEVALSVELEQIKLERSKPLDKLAVNTLDLEIREQAPSRKRKELTGPISPGLGTSFGTWTGREDQNHQVW